MDVLTFGTACAMVFVVSSANTPAWQKGCFQPGATVASPWQDAIAEAAARFDIPSAWIGAVMRTESGGRAAAISPVGAMGLMQIMPRTYADLKRRYGLGDDPFAPRDNILAGAAYLREMYDRFGGTGFLAAYNAGPNRVSEYQTNGRALPEETRRYVAMLGPDIDPASALFPQRSTSASGFGSTKNGSQNDGGPLFFTLKKHTQLTANPEILERQ